MIRDDLGWLVRHIPHAILVLEVLLIGVTAFLIAAAEAVVR